MSTAYHPDSNGGTAPSAKPWKITLWEPAPGGTAPSLHQIVWDIQNTALYDLCAFLLSAGLEEDDVKTAWHIVAQSYNEMHEFLDVSAK